jgi:hypothetical protein
MAHLLSDRIRGLPNGARSNAVRDDSDVKITPAKRQE